MLNMQKRKGKQTPKQRASYESLCKYFYAAGEKVSMEMTVYVRDEVEGSLEPFEDVKIVLMLSGDDNCGIRVICKEQDLTEYEDLGMEASYSVKTATFKYEETRDYQSAFRILKIYPKGFKTRFIFLNPNEINSN